MKRRDEVLVGVLITVAIVVVIGGTLWLARKGLGANRALYTRLAWGAGLKQGQPVLLQGVQVGTIKSIEYNSGGFIEVMMDVSRKYFEGNARIPEGTQAKVQQISFFGDMAIALDPMTARRPATGYLEAGDTVPAAPPPVTINDLVARFDTVSRDVRDMTDKIQIEFVRGGGIADLRQTVASMNRLAESLNAVAQAQSRNLTVTMASLRRTLSAVDSATVDSTLRNVRATSERFAGLTTDLQQTSTRLNSLLARLETGDGTAAKLLNDPGLYYDLRNVLMQADSLMADVKRNPKKYINVKVF
jgi:phospholipid/cholesterol/gamma-HCH transport system substrate-binding protein